MLKQLISYEISEILTRIKQEIARGKKVLVNCVSKSGGTTETIALLDIIEDVINYKEIIKNILYAQLKENLN